MKSLMSQQAHFLLESWSNHSGSGQYQDRPSLFSPRPNRRRQGNRVSWHRWPGDHLGRLERTDRTDSKACVCCCKCDADCYIIYSNFQSDGGRMPSLDQSYLTPCCFDDVWWTNGCRHHTGIPYCNHHILRQSFLRRRGWLSRCKITCPLHS